MITRLQLRTNHQIRITYSYTCKVIKLFVVTIFILINVLSASVSSFPFPLHVPNKTVSYSRSAQGLRNLVYADLQIAKFLTKNVHKLPYKSYLRRASEIYLEDVQKGAGVTNLKKFDKAEALAIAKNPIGSYRTIRRMVTLLPDLSWHANDIFEIPGEEALQNLYRGMPDRHDLNQSMDAILRLHLVYDFNIKLFANGNISGVLTGAKLDAVHCYEIGVYGSASGEYYAQAVDWLDLALQKITTNGEKGIDKGIVATAFSNAVEKHDDALAKADIRQHSKYFVDPIIPQIESGPRNFSQRKTRRSFDYGVYKGNAEHGLETYNFWALCSGENFQTVEEKSELFCWLEFKVHPYFFIGPMKMEFLTRSPDLVRVYDVFGEKAMEAIIEDTSESMGASAVVDHRAEGSGTPKEILMHDVRTSENTWLDEKLDKFQPLSKTISHLTGMNARAGRGSEMFQIASYTTSGHYYSHLDSGLPVEHQIAPDGSHWGDRIATFMIYMSDVETGGYTAFPNLGVAVKPVKGSAVFWHNVFRSEQLDRLTYHGGCPVLIGQKYIANKWIRYTDQFSTHNCTTNPEDQFHVLVNQKHIPASQVVRNTKVNTHITSPAGGFGFNSTKYSYRSIRGLKALAKTEQELYIPLKLSYLQLNENASTAIEMDEAFEENHLCAQSYLKDFEDSTGKLGSRRAGTSFNDFEILPPETISWNPIAAYRMLWRADKYLKKWSNSKNQKWSTSYQNVFKKVKSNYRCPGCPTADDMKDAKLALLSMQYVYDLNASDIAAGMLAGRSAGVSLNALHCYEIGMEAVSLGMFTLGIDWLEAALFKAKYSTDTSIGQKKLQQALNDGKKKHDKQHLTSGGWEPRFYERRFSESHDHHSVRKMTRKKVQYNAFRLHEEPNFAEINFNGVCSGKPHLSPIEQSRLFCWYETEIHPYWKINPLKAEIHSLRPKLEVVQYYNLLSDKLMDSLKQHVTNTNDHTLVFEGPQVTGAVSVWVPEVNSTDALNISKLIERVTGLTVQNHGDPSVVDFQVRAYAPGGTHQVHMDVPNGILPGSTSAQNIATFMFYISDVKLGGYTAFAQSGAKIVPRKGSGIFWYNLLSSGHPNKRTYHGGCPLVLGEKWIASKWISYEAQKNHVCHTSKSSISEILVNGVSKYL